MTRHHDLNAFGRVGDELIDLRFGEHALVYHVKNLIQHDHIVAVGERRGGAALEYAAVEHGGPVLFGVGHVKGEFEVQRTVGQRHVVELAEDAPLARGIGFEKLHKEHAQSGAGSTHCQSDSSGGFSFAVTVINMYHINPPF